MFSKVKNYLEYDWEQSYFKNGELVEMKYITDEDLFLTVVITNQREGGTAVADIDKRIVGSILEDKCNYAPLENINLFNDVLRYLKKHNIDVILTNIPIEVEMNPIDSVRLFNIGNHLLEQDFNIRVEVTNVVEEVYELTGLESDEARKKAKEFVATLDFPENLSDDVIIDSFGDMNVLSSGAILKKGYDPVKVLREISKEINSRKGEIIDGKFTKCKTEECKSEWYKADFNKCKLSID